MKWDVSRQFNRELFASHESGRQRPAAGLGCQRAYRDPVVFCRPSNRTSTAPVNSPRRHSTVLLEKARMLFQDRGVKVNHDHVLQAIDSDKRVATYKTPAGTAEQACDFINVVPPIRAHEVVRNSPLPWT